MLFCLTINLGTISNMLLGEVKIVWRRGSSSEKKKKDASGKTKGMWDLNILLFPCTHSYSKAR
jgi:hypothetical protein